MDFKKFGLSLFSLLFLASLVFATNASVGATTITGYSHIGSNYYGVGTIVGGTAVASSTHDLNTSSCQYTIDGATWLPASYSTNHCQKTSFTITGGKNYVLNTRIDDNVGTHVVGTAVSVQGAMLSSDMTSATLDIVGQFLAGIASNSVALVALLVLAIVMVLLIDLVTNVFGIIKKIKEVAGR